MQMPIEEEEYWRAHTPVLLDEVIRWLRPEKGGIFVDCTLGLGGHSEAFLEASPETRVIAIDRDLDALERSRLRMARFEGRFQAVHANFDELAEVMELVKLSEAQGILADLGVSSMQLDTDERGFSFGVEAPLDMRMDRTRKETAAELIARLTERELADLIFEYGEERGARKVARAIARERARQPIISTRQLADVVVRALKVPGRWRIHPATRTFQAIRIAVNDELGALRSFIPEAVSHLARGGRLAIISFHSLEDRIVKQGFQRESGRCICPPEIRSAGPGGIEAAVCSFCGARKRVSVLTRKPVSPGREEMERNPRSRSARLRVCERL
jgi:16S rRNA (cytosine1402-N4)-methyltransferase